MCPTPSQVYVEAMCPTPSQMPLPGSKVIADERGTSPTSGAKAVETLLVVDVDGVLNVSIRAQDGGTLLLSDDNVEHSSRLLERTPSGRLDSSRRIASVASHRLPGEGSSTYGSLACEGDEMTCSV